MTFNIENYPRARKLKGTGTCMWADTFKEALIKRLRAMPPMTIRELAEKRGISRRTAQNMIYELASYSAVFSYRDPQGSLRYVCS